MGSRIKQNPETTFEVYVEVTNSASAGPDPEVRKQFPKDYSDQEILQTLTKFCFPFCVDSLTVGQVGQNFTFVLTDIDSKQRFGFCRLSSGAKTCFCILSYLPWFEVFYKLLNILADYTAKDQDSQWYELLEMLYKLPIPEPGSSVHLSVHSYFTVPDNRELPSIPENRNLTEYFVAVDVNNMLHLYASMLYERRILICCSKLSTLTACIHGSAAMLYPMFWQHVYIPVLPPHLLDYCGAPMPYLIGIHLSLVEKVRNMALEDVVVLNVDTNTLETPFDDLQSLPNDVVSALKSRLKKVSMTTGDGVARAFLKAQAAFFGSYRNALKIEPVRPPRPQVARRPKSNVATDGQRTSVSSPDHLVKPTRHYTVFLSEDSSGDEFPQEDDPGSAFSDSFLFSAPFEWPQPYRALKESKSAESEESVNPERPQDGGNAAPPTPDSPVEISLLGGIFSGLEMKPPSQLLSQAKSLEDLRIPKDEGDQQGTFDYQRMDPGISEKSWISPGMKFSHPYKQLWGLGQDDMAIPTKYSQSSPERPLAPLENMSSAPWRPRSRDSILDLPEKDIGTSSGSQGNITIPRPQGRKTPELGIVPLPPAPRLAKQQALLETATCLAGPSDLASELMLDTFAPRNISLDPEFRQPAGFATHQHQLLPSSGHGTQMLQPVKVCVEDTSSNNDSLLAFLDPLKAGSCQEMSFQPSARSLLGSSSPNLTTGFPTTAGDLMPPVPATLGQPLGYPPSAAPFGQASLNPFVQATPAPVPLSLVRPPGSPFAPPLGHAYSSSIITSHSTFYQPQRPPPNPLTLSMPNLFAQPPAAPMQSQLPPQSNTLQPAKLCGSSKIRTLPLTHSASKLETKTRLAARPSDLPLVPHKAKAVESVLLPSKPQATKDPFEDLLNKTKQEVSVTPGKVEQMRRQWETFE
ncbi:DENN domain-containing protein 1A isoform X5 [Podarcis raffonei]|uniref:DENN domain-containing protein 1A isoform X5 n=1 Tax=Podarcis raffonei TaxID=65483 RepID=UPI0023299B29|nr:DENN domain-containing protein 1A isoform X5 [Podarcis raffonei]